MRLTSVLISLLLVSAGLGGCAVTQTVPVMELHNKRTLNLTAEIHRTTVATRAPTVILLHGCGGPQYPHMQTWIDALTAWGFNAVVLNSLSARGVSQVCNRPASVVTHEQRALDAYETAKWVIQQAWATDKVGIIGFSHGGATVISSAASRDVERNMGKQVIAAGVAYYPWCASHYSWQSPVMPVQFHTGGKDSWTPPDQCRDLSKSWGLADQHFHYDEATHGFDMLGMNTLSAPDAFGQRHWLKYDRPFTDLSRQRTRQFLDKFLR
jgi:dienelactone hydrolase